MGIKEVGGVEETARRDEKYVLIQNSDTFFDCVAKMTIA